MVGGELFETQETHSGEPALLQRRHASETPVDGIALLKELDQISQADIFARESVQHVYNNIYTL